MHQRANFVKIGQSIAKILRFLHFSTWQLPPSSIAEFAKFYWLTVSEGHRCITVPNFVKICGSIAEIKNFHIFKMAAAAILDFLNRKILLAIVVERVELHQHAKFRQNRSIGCEYIDFLIFQDGGRRHFELLNLQNFIA